MPISHSECASRKALLLRIAALSLIIFTTVCAVEFLVITSGESHPPRKAAATASATKNGYVFDGEAARAPGTSGCNVRGIDIKGALQTYLHSGDTGMTSSEDVVDAINAADADPQYGAILLAIDSSGGDPVAGEEIANALRAAKKPNVVVIRSLGTSAAYWAASGADLIYASKNSMVGSIGVTMSYVEKSGQLRSSGLRYVELSSGPHKGLSNPDRPLSAQEQAMIQKDVNKMAEVFVESVAANRNLSVDEVRKYADGSWMLGQDAIKVGLVDRIGSFPQAQSYIAEQINEPAVSCW